LIAQEAILQFANDIDRHLFQGSQTVLVGDTPTVADVVVAMALGAAAAAVVVASTNNNNEGRMKLPQQTYRWYQTTLQNIRSIVVVGGQPTFRNHETTIAAIQQYVDAVQEGDPSPLEKETPVNTVPTTTAPPVAVDTTTTSPKDATTVVAAVGGDTKDATTTTTGGSDNGNPIIQLLDQYGLSYELYDHVKCTTAEELVANVPVGPNETHTKNLFLRDKKHGYFLVSMSTESSNVNTKELGKILKLAGKTNLRLADESILDSKLHVQPGCVGPLTIAMADPKASDDEKVTLVLDRSLLEKYQSIHSHPLRNDQSVKLTPEALRTFFQNVGVEPVLIEGTPQTATTTTTTTTTTTDHLPGKAPANRPPATKMASEPKDDKKKKTQDKNKDKKTSEKGKTLLSLQWKKSENFAMWYTDVIVLSEMISYYDVSGCYILRPWSYKIWELIQRWFDERIQKDMGVENAYFPLFVSQDRLEREKDHVEGFAPEVAWVTKSGDTDLAKQIAIRPTSETIMYPAFSDWIKSHRDLPLKLNQWSNVVRWEFKYPTPFLRTREFLWQEGHTAHTTFEDADATVMQALELYRRVYEELLAVPVVPGYKTEKEKFAGGFRTTTVEAYVAGSGRAIQGATSHNLGQNFGKMFDIYFQDEQGQTQIAWQTSWGLTTRTIGVMVMVHGDDTGLVLPPRIAPLQVVIVPIVSKNFTQEQANPYCEAILADLQNAGLRCKYDDRTLYNPGWKYNHWEQKGVPVRIEVGPRDVENKSARIAIRYNGAKDDVPVDGIGALLKTKLEEIQVDMFEKAKEARDSHIVQVTEWKDFVPNLEKHNLVLTPWIGGDNEQWEDWVKEKSREESLKARGEEEEDAQTSTSVAAKTLCIPFKQPDLPPGTKCFASGEEAKCWVLWGRSY
jgi:prolyl-tRNA synthetase